MNPESFFTNNYKLLREQPPMKWMERLFSELQRGEDPDLIDLPTGAGKTELVVIWMIALAWHGISQSAAHAIPRRLVWVINRRVLVQQVFDLAERLQKKLLKSDDSSAFAELREGLAAVSGDPAQVFSVVQLRGQIVADREWSTQPTVPQLIIGTVDQIGSRVLFQGYGLGKWNRPQQAAMLGVDAWICVDEAHLVPAFVLTLRQLRPLCAELDGAMPPALAEVFGRLPFWLTELSATPSLPPPSTDKGFKLFLDEEDDPPLADRILASRTRRVEILWLPNGEKPQDILANTLATAAMKMEGEVNAVAIFVRTVSLANKIVMQLKKVLRENNKSPDNVCKITGRLRGYERDRMVKNPVFQCFLPQSSDTPRTVEGTVFLVGTAAAEVGLDADADAIFCDFAPLPTLLQRLGRLDRRGALSRKAAEGRREPPTMMVFAFSLKETAKLKKAKAKLKTTVKNLAVALKADTKPCSVELMVGAAWQVATAKPENDVNEPKSEDDGDNAETSEEEGDEQKEQKKFDLDELIDTATWQILGEGKHEASGFSAASPSKWLAQEGANVAAGPVAVPPLMPAVLEHWSATTDSRNKYVAAHPFLYGIVPTEEGVPLVGVVFRLEVNALCAMPTVDGIEENEEETNTAQQLTEIFHRFPPQRAERHQIPLAGVRDWLESAATIPVPMVFRKGDKWRVKVVGEECAALRRGLTPDTTIILPASEELKPIFKKLFKNENISEETFCDVLNGVSEGSRYRRRVVERRLGDQVLHECKEHAFCWNLPEKNSDIHLTKIPATTNLADEINWSTRLPSKFTLFGGVYLFEYLKPTRNVPFKQYLRSFDGQPGHLERAAEDAVELAQAVAPGNTFLASLLRTAADRHDEGKRHPKWQSAMGNQDAKEPMLAKSDLIKPLSLGGFRHEWHSLRLLFENMAAPPAHLSRDEDRLWRDLLLHLIATHHGHLRPSIEDEGFDPCFAPGVQNSQRLEASERFMSLQRQIGPWRLAYLEALLKTTDVSASQRLNASTVAEEDEPDET